jgi:hypothetical protein
MTGTKFLRISAMMMMMVMTMMAIITGMLCLSC